MKDQFTEAMMDVYRQVLSETNYNPSGFHKIVAERGGYDAAIDLIHRKEPPEGFSELAVLGRLDLTAEALVLDPKWHDLFTDEDRQAAYNRLKQYGYAFPTGSWHPSPSYKTL
jgi:hypothetical protein